MHTATEMNHRQATNGQGSHAGHEGHEGPHGAMMADYRRRFWASLLLTVPVLLLSPMIKAVLGLERVITFPGELYVLWLLSSVIYVYGGWPFLRGLRREMAARAAGMMTLIALAISVAYFYSSAVVFGLAGEVFFWELATLIDVMLLGHWIEMRSVAGASGALEALVKLLPTTAHRLTDGGLEDVSVTALRKGDRLLVRPGEKVPVDGVVVKGRSSLNESMLTGESRPVTRGEGAEVIGGSVNGEGALTVEIRKTGEETYLAQVIELVRQAQGTRSRTQDVANRAAGWLTYIALSVGAATLVSWLVVGYGLEFSLERMVTVMVITCPHALGLAVPLVVAVSTSLAARRGLLIRNRAAFERARDLKAVIFDKTGTLTEGRFGVTDVVALADMGIEEILRLAGSLERSSEHPIARGIVEESARRKIALAPVSEFRNITGQGAEGLVGGRHVMVVSPGYLSESGQRVEDDRLQRLGAEGKTVVYVLWEHTPVGAIALADVVRPESREAIHRLKAMGIQCMMLTGDSQAVARTVAQELHLDDYFAEVLPHQKAEKIREVKRRGLAVAMVGDGVNDAPALVEADLGIAIGAGTEVAIQSADVILVRNDPRDVVAIATLSRATYNKMVQNLLWATGYNVVAIPAAAGLTWALGFLLTPALGAALMSISTVIVAINARLLGRSRRVREEMAA